MRILYEQYGPNLTQDNMIKVVALLTEYETGDSVVAIRDVYIQNPEIKIRVSEASDAPTHGSSVLALCHSLNNPPPLCSQILGEPMQERKLVAEIRLVNPLAEPLNNCIFVVEGAGLTEGQRIEEL